jgi:hypothetical protein
MNKKEFVELAVQAYSLKLVNPEEYFANLYDKAFKDAEDKLNKVLKELDMMHEELLKMKLR